MVGGDHLEKNGIRLSKADPLILNEKALKFELEEAFTRESTYEAQLFQQTCDDIRDKITEFKRIKHDNSNGTTLVKQTLKREICMSILDLKKFNRVDKLRHKMIRDQVLEARQKVDQNHLQFQNLLYESIHLQKEISKCADFKSKMDEIDLISREELFSSIENEEEKQALLEDNHACTRARLNFELVERKRLLNVLEEKQKQKSQVACEIEDKKKNLENLKPLVETIMNAINNATTAF